MSASRSLALFFLLVIASGCGDEPTSSGGGPQPPATGPGKYSYSFLAHHMRYLGSNGVYVAWVKYIGDSAYSQHTPMLSFFRPPPDSMTFNGEIVLRHGADSIVEILVSVEQDTGAAQPSSPLMKGSVSQLSAFLSADSIFGKLDEARATVTFATRSADTSRAQHEFYLMTLAGGIPTASSINFPVAAPGWKYALWVTDSGFEPKHLFYYGSFADPAGPDSDTADGEYSFPGGYRPNPLTDPGADILLTLEPTFRLNGRPAAPLPFNVMQLPLKRFIHFGEEIPMTNVAATGIPEGYFSLKKK